MTLNSGLSGLRRCLSFYCLRISAASFSFCQKTQKLRSQSDRVCTRRWTENLNASRTSLTISLSSSSSLLLVLLFESLCKTKVHYTPAVKLWRKLMGRAEQRPDNRPIILVAACFCSSCLLWWPPGDSDSSIKSSVGPLPRESKQKNKESTFPAARRGECWSSPEAIRSGRGLSAPIVSLYFGVSETRERCCFSPSSSSPSLPVPACVLFYACKLTRESRTKASIGLGCMYAVVRLPTSKNTASVRVAHRPAGILPVGQSWISPRGTFCSSSWRTEKRKEVGFHTLPLAAAAFSTYMWVFFHSSFARLYECETLIRYRERWTGRRVISLEAMFLSTGLDKWRPMATRDLLWFLIWFKRHI